MQTHINWDLHLRENMWFCSFWHILSPCIFLWIFLFHFYLELNSILFYICARFQDHLSVDGQPDWFHPFFANDKSMRHRKKDTISPAAFIMLMGHLRVSTKSHFSGKWLSLKDLQGRQDGENEALYWSVMTWEKWGNTERLSNAALADFKDGLWIAWDPKRKENMWVKTALCMRDDKGPNREGVGGLEHKAQEMLVQEPGLTA